MSIGIGYNPEPVLPVCLIQAIKANSLYHLLHGTQKWNIHCTAIVTVFEFAPANNFTVTASPTVALAGTWR